jgi:hypothetical protein
MGGARRDDLKDAGAEEHPTPGQAEGEEGGNSPTEIEPGPTPGSAEGEEPEA